VYSAAVIDHFRNPRNAGIMRDADGVGQGEHADCMDLVRIYLRVSDGVVREARFQSYGCGPCIAASSVATELATGRDLREAAELGAPAVERALGGLPDNRRHAADVAARAIRAASRDAIARTAGAAREENAHA
jgi:nitrogen fixation NifU-like protein